MSCVNVVSYSEGGTIIKPAITQPEISGGKAVGLELQGPTINGGLTADTAVWQAIAAAIAPLLPPGSFLDTQNNPLALGAVLLQPQDLLDATEPAKIAGVLRNKDGNALSPDTKLMSVKEIKEYVEAQLCALNASYGAKTISVVLDPVSKILTLTQEDGGGVQTVVSGALSALVTGTELAAALTTLQDRSSKVTAVTYDGSTKILTISQTDESGTVSSIAVPLTGVVSTAELNTALDALKPAVSDVTAMTFDAATKVLTVAKTNGAGVTTTVTVPLTGLVTAAELAAEVAALEDKVEEVLVPTASVPAQLSSGGLPTLMVGGQNKLLGEPDKYFEYVDSGVTYLVPMYLK